MKITCDVIRDLLPLYAENLTSDATRRLVEEHLDTCEACQKQLAEMKASPGPTPEMDVVPLRKLNQKYQKKKFFTVAVSVLLSLAAAVIVLGFLVSPKYLPYTPDLVTLTESSDGVIYASFDDRVSGCGVSSFFTDEGDGYACHIVAWDSIWNRYLLKNKTQNVVLNPDGEQIKAVYYYETNGTGEILIYGQQQNPCGVIIRQPKLALIAGFAAALVFLCILLTAIFHHNPRAVRCFLSVLPLPASYLIGHLTVKGFSFSSYMAAHDFYANLMVAIPCCALLYGIVLKFFYRRTFPRK